MKTVVFQRSVERRKNQSNLWGEEHKVTPDMLEQVQRRNMEVVGGLEHFSYKEKLQELGLFSLEWRRHWQVLTASLSIYEGGLQERWRKTFYKAL